MSAGSITVRGLLAVAKASTVGSDSSRESELLLSHALQRERAWLFAHADDPIDPADAVRFHSLLVRRAAGEPIAYITGRREFWSLDLAVTPDVLIPRPETELLVELALRRISQSAQTDIADLGTGSGAVALAIAHERPRAAVLATDVSVAALAVARANAQHLDLDNVQFMQSDWCAALDKRRFDLIVSNPPYVAESDVHLSRGDLRFEPRAALASGSDGLDAIHAIVRDAPMFLKPGGWLLFEHGHDQGGAVRDLLGKSGFVEVFTAPDLAGHELVSGGRTG